MEIKREKKKEKRNKKKMVVKIGLMEENGRGYGRCGEEGLDELLWTVELDSPEAVCGEMNTIVRGTDFWRRLLDKEGWLSTNVLLKMVKGKGELFSTTSWLVDVERVYMPLNLDRH
ncbi:hypothetical protein DVH24_015486 [Malus domestica]|uniref:Uncharacterized protein n=1 Tax=Malus domestica TaxID=3750 RepID=A0A498HKN8_MALDO|nr:hypothetical protein DVH24_015486 [Malus domestica]